MACTENVFAVTTIACSRFEKIEMLTYDIKAVYVDHFTTFLSQQRMNKLSRIEQVIDIVSLLKSQFLAFRMIKL
ncbi:CLUMA_CG007886, isoform A [Clunio marinus]|uniref:CLUMA_CG007886, isoform A n=1 Tax=Clunio marinus TaxID=568069 RepID=A0A1J1I7I6_9DIPT|nr:CLUMA_CG007886, isoform A [Clunio marinus]